MLKNKLLKDAADICISAINSCLPEKGVKDALKDLDLKGDIYLVSVGKASFTMTKAAAETVDIKEGIVISKYGHIKGEIEKVRCFEAGHPIVDENSIAATGEVIRMCSGLKDTDTVLFLLSGGASALFEKPLIDLNRLQDINRQMLNNGLNINEINTIRKKLSSVKGGRFADLCKPAKVYAIILSDVLGDDLSTIGSGPTVKDKRSVSDALEIIDRYHLRLDADTLDKLKNSKDGDADNATNIVIGSVRMLCEYAEEKAKELGYETYIITDSIDIEARKAGDLLYQELLKHEDEDKVALIMGGETIVNVKGNGLGGRNQELVLSQVEHLKDMDDVLMMSLGSDGTDGPTDAAGGYIDNDSFNKLKTLNIDYREVLENNDAYHALERIGGLIITGPTGTNVNDISIILKDHEDTV